MSYGNHNLGGIMFTVTVSSGSTSYSRERAKRRVRNRWERRRSEWATASLENAAQLRPRVPASRHRPATRPHRRQPPGRFAFYQGAF